MKFLYANNIFFAFNYVRPKGLHAQPGCKSISNLSEIFGGTEATFRGKRRLSRGSRVLGIDESHRKLDPIPDRPQNRKIVVSPMLDDDKGEHRFLKEI